MFVRQTKTTQGRMRFDLHASEAGTRCNVLLNRIQATRCVTVDHRLRAHVEARPKRTLITHSPRSAIFVHGFTIE